MAVWSETKRTSILLIFLYYTLCLLSSFWSPLPKFSAYRAIEFMILLMGVLVALSYAQNFAEAERNILFISFIVILSSILYAQSDLEKRISRLPGIISVEQIEPDSGYAEAFKIFIQQPVDHFNQDGEKFQQKFYLSHRDESFPMVIELDGYNIDYNRPNELSEILQSNKIVVEHRYFGESYPENAEWKYLTIKQSANDHHNIIERMKQIYTGKWVTTGISKGGQTTMYHKYFFPADADASVCYVAPLNLAAEDPRIYHFLDNVGTEDLAKNMGISIDYRVWCNQHWDIPTCGYI